MNSRGEYPINQPPTALLSMKSHSTSTITSMTPQHITQRARNIHSPSTHSPTECRQAQTKREPTPHENSSPLTGENVRIRAATTQRRASLAAHQQLTTTQPAPPIVCTLPSSTNKVWSIRWRMDDSDVSHTCQHQHRRQCDEQCRDGVSGWSSRGSRGRGQQR